MDEARSLAGGAKSARARSAGGGVDDPRSGGGADKVSRSGDGGEADGPAASNGFFTPGGYMEAGGVAGGVGGAAVDGAFGRAEPPPEVNGGATLDGPLPSAGPGNGGAVPPRLAGGADMIGGWAGKLGGLLESRPGPTGVIGAFRPGISIFGGLVSPDRPGGKVGSGERFNER